METFAHAHEGYCNFRLFGDVAVPHVDDSMVIHKMGKLSDLIRDQTGRRLEEVYGHLPWLPVHLFQSFSGIVKAYLDVATNTTLVRATVSGTGVALANFDGADSVADGIIESVRGAFVGNGLGLFRDPPHSAPWFSTTRPSQTKPSARASSTPESAPKQQKTVDPERSKGLGVLLFDPSAQGANDGFLDRVPVKAKKRNGKNPERLCMRFLSRGFAYVEEVCKRPHVGNLNTLSDANRTKFCEYVGRTPGLSFVPGKEPAGMS